MLHLPPAQGRDHNPNPSPNPNPNPNPNQDDFYGASADFSEKALSAFVASFLAGELTPHVKPEPDYSAGGGEDDEDGGEGDEGGDEDDDKEEM